MRKRQRKKAWKKWRESPAYARAMLAGATFFRKKFPLPAPVRPFMSPIIKAIIRQKNEETIRKGLTPFLIDLAGVDLGSSEARTIKIFKPASGGYTGEREQIERDLESDGA